MPKLTSYDAEEVIRLIPIGNNHGVLQKPGRKGGSRPEFCRTEDRTMQSRGSLLVDAEWNPVSREGRAADLIRFANASKTNLFQGP